MPAGNEAENHGLTLQTALNMVAREALRFQGGINTTNILAKTQVKMCEQCKRSHEKENYEAKSKQCTRWKERWHHRHMRQNPWKPWPKRNQSRKNGDNAVYLEMKMMRSAFIAIRKVTGRTLK